MRSLLWPRVHTIPSEFSLPSSGYALWPVHPASQTRKLKMPLITIWRLKPNPCKRKKKANKNENNKIIIWVYPLNHWVGHNLPWSVQWWFVWIAVVHAFAGLVIRYFRVFGIVIGNACFNHGLNSLLAKTVHSLDWSRYLSLHLWKANAFVQTDIFWNSWQWAISTIYEITLALYDLDDLKDQEAILGWPQV